VPEDITTPYRNSEGPLVPYNSHDPKHVGYINALQHDQTMNGMPGYSCVASIMTNT
jgi:hypothetical protein